LREQAWPEDLLGHAALELYYARALTQYAQAYAWEVNQREKVDTRGEVDLKAWTREQLYEEAVRAFASVWKHREQLGGQPLGALGEFLQPNTYPQGIRPTLRDAATYLFVELLTDTRGWRPEHENEIFRLDLPAHLAADGRLWPRGVSAELLSDPEVHPLTRASAALAELEAWHAGGKRPEAALEAYLVRVEQLHARFAQAEDRARVRAALEARLAAGKELPWWSAGMASLAGMVRQEEAPDALVRARELGIRGREAHPDMLGGQRCHALVEAIEAPGYSLQAMAVDGPERRSLAITHRNLEAVWVRAYPVDILAYFEQANDWDIFPRYEELEKIFKKTRPAKVWKAELPPTPDYRDHRTYLTPPLAKPGFYVLVASAREGFGRADNVMNGAFFQVSDLVISTRQDRDGTEVMVQSGASGRPVAGAEVLLYRRDWQKKHHVVARLATDARGAARLPVYEIHNHFLVARH
jgi:hypothetical protein